MDTKIKNSIKHTPNNWAAKGLDFAHQNHNITLTAFFVGHFNL